MLLSKSNTTSWEETLRYASPSRSATDALPGKGGLITEWTQQQKGTSADGATTAETYAFSYDKAGRLTGSLRYIDTSTSSVNTLTEQSISYDHSGNLLTLDRYDDSSATTPTESLSFSYSGPKRTGWSYDAHGNVTSDPSSGQSIAWNIIDLPRVISAGTASTQRTYLADGTLHQVSDGNVVRLYLGSMVFLQASGATVLESAGWDGGRLLPGSGTDKVLYYVTDHLGSTRVVKDGSGNIRQRYDYYPYGSVSRSWSSNSSTNSPDKRYRFGGKEIAGSGLNALSASAVPYLDFGARLYSPGTAMWLSQDPMAEKYYPLTPYMYCAGSPGNVVDPEGEDWYRFWGRDGLVHFVYDDNVYSASSLLEMGIDGEYLGKTYIDEETNTYFSLFGERMSYKNKSGELNSLTWLYQHIDNLLIEYYSREPSEPTPYEDFYWGGLQPRKYGKEYSFIFKGQFEGESFSSSDGTVFVPINNPNNAIATIWESPKKQPRRMTDKFGYLNLNGHFLRINNDKGTDIVRIYFRNTKDALLYMSAIDKQFVHR